MKTVKSILCTLLGTSLLGIGMGMFVKAGIGSDSLTLFYEGLSKNLNITVGTVSVIVNLIFLTCVFFMDRKRIGLATVIALFYCKYPIDIANRIYNAPDSLILNILIEIVLCFIMALGCALVVKANMGATAYDSFTLSLSKVTKIKYTYVRYGCDFTWLVLGYFLGGTVGIGTIIATICIGPMFSLCMKILKTE